MKNKNVFKMCCAAVFAAVIFVMTTYTRIPVPFFQHGYFNLGDSFIIIAALCLGPVWGGLAGAVGAGLSDLFGYADYSLATFIIKWCMAVAVYYIYKVICKINKKLDIIAIIVASIVCETIMVAGYFVFEWMLYGNIFIAIASVIGNVIQGVCNIIASSILFSILNKSGLLKRIFG